MAIRRRKIQGKYTFCVYVIEMNTRKDGTPCKPWFYVGQTCHTPQKRFANHKAGHKASRIVKKYGKRLRLDLAAHLPRFDTREEAEYNEAKLARQIRSDGCFVTSA